MTMRGPSDSSVRGRDTGQGAESTGGGFWERLRGRVRVRPAVWRILVPFVLIVGLAGPPLAEIVFEHTDAEARFDHQVDLTLSGALQILAEGMEQPVWNLVPENGRALVSSVMRDPHILGIHVMSDLQGVFLQAGQMGFGLESDVAETGTRDIVHNGQNIGMVMVRVDATRIREEVDAAVRNDQLVEGLQILFAFVSVGLLFLVTGRMDRQKSVLETNKALQTEVRERRDVERRLSLAVREAEEANMAKSSFLATMSHELRTPLNAILGFSDILRNQYLGPIENPKYLEYAGDISDSGKYLLELINDILDISKIEAGQYALNVEPLDAWGVVQDTIRLLQDRAAARDLSIEWPQLRTPVMIRADRRALKQMLVNVLGNALKFTPEGGFIRIAITTEDGSALIAVSDNGPGIPATEIPFILEPFRTSRSDPNVSWEGSGLGLAITKSLAELHGGMVEIQSVIDEGTTVCLFLPLLKDETAGADAAGESGDQGGRDGPSATGGDGAAADPATGNDDIPRRAAC